VHRGPQNSPRGSASIRVCGGGCRGRKGSRRIRRQLHNPWIRRLDPQQSWPFGGVATASSRSRFAKPRRRSQKWRAGTCGARTQWRAASGWLSGPRLHKAPLASKSCRRFRTRVRVRGIFTKSAADPDGSLKNVRFAREIMAQYCNDEVAREQRVPSRLV
jgi:hypothetical protein